MNDWNVDVVDMDLGSLGGNDFSLPSIGSDGSFTFGPNDTMLDGMSNIDIVHPGSAYVPQAAPDGSLNFDEAKAVAASDPSLEWLAKDGGPIQAIENAFAKANVTGISMNQTAAEIYDIPAFITALDAGANTFTKQSLTALEKQISVMPAKQAGPFMTKMLLDYGQKPKNGLNPANWGAGEWISAASLLITWMENEKAREENKYRYEREMARVDRIDAQNQANFETQMAFNESTKKTPGSGISGIKKTSIYT